MSDLTAPELIERLGLAPLPVEGGHFAQTWVADESVPGSALPGRYGRDKRLGSAIFYLLADEPECFSALHRLASDEVYHFYLGDPVEMLLLHAGGRAERPVLGPDLRAGQHVQLVVPRTAWQGSRLAAGGRWALMGTTMAPGFDPGDFELGERRVLEQSWPEQAALIRRLTRP